MVAVTSRCWNKDYYNKARIFGGSKFQEALVKLAGWKMEFRELSIWRRMSLNWKKGYLNKGTAWKNHIKMSLNIFCSYRFLWISFFFLLVKSFLHLTVTGFCVYCYILFCWCYSAIVQFHIFGACCFPVSNASTIFINICGLELKSLWSISY